MDEKKLAELLAALLAPFAEKLDALAAKLDAPAADEKAEKTEDSEKTEKPEKAEDSETDTAKEDTAKDTEIAELKAKLAELEAAKTDAEKLELAEELADVLDATTDTKAMDINSLAALGLEKLGIKAAKGQERSALDAALQMRKKEKPAQTHKVADEQTVATIDLDSLFKGA